jgi:hypothetical protein
MNMKRGPVLCLCALALSVGAAHRASAQQTVRLSLDLFYSDPQNSATSAGAWQLLATSTGNGLAGLTTSITGNSSTSAADLIFRANTGIPAETYKTLYDAKTWFTDTDANAATLNMLFGQVPVAAPGPQLITYNMGIAGGTNPVPFVDRLSTSVDIPGQQTAPNGPDIAMTNAVVLAIGRFAAGTTPAFVAGSSAANVFTAIPATPATNPPAVGTIVAATVTTQVRSNAGNLAGQAANQGTIQGDVTLDRTTAGADLLTLLPNLNVGNQLWQNGDLNGDHIVAGADLLLLLPKLNQSDTPAVASVGAVPEPTSVGLATLASIGFASLARRRRVR